MPRAEQGMAVWLCVWVSLQVCCLGSCVLSSEASKPWIACLVLRFRGSWSERGGHSIHSIIGSDRLCVVHSPRLWRRFLVCDFSFHLHYGPLWCGTLISLCYRVKPMLLCFLVGCCDVHPCFFLKDLGVEEAQNWLINLVNRGTSQTDQEGNGKYYLYTLKRTGREGTDWGNYVVVKGILLCVGC